LWILSQPRSATERRFLQEILPQQVEIQISWIVLQESNAHLPHTPAKKRIFLYDDLEQQRRKQCRCCVDSFKDKYKMKERDSNENTMNNRITRAILSIESIHRWSELMIKEKYRRE
jgi:hypothetical protein